MLYNISLSHRINRTPDQVQSTKSGVGPSDRRMTSKSPYFKGFFEALRATSVQRALSQNYLTLFEKNLVKFVLPFSVTGN